MICLKRYIDEAKDAWEHGTWKILRIKLLYLFILDLKTGMHLANPLIKEVEGK